MDKAIVVTNADYRVEETPWGSLTWFVSAGQGSSSALTVGRCVINPGCANPRHYHPNCEEVLHVLEGEILHGIGDTEVRMSPGDTISLPAELPHNARNVGAGNAVLLICFSSAERQTVGE